MNIKSIMGRDYEELIEGLSNDTRINLEQKLERENLRFFLKEAEKSLSERLRFLSIINSGLYFSVPAEDGWYNLLTIDGELILKVFEGNKYSSEELGALYKKSKVIPEVEAIQSYIERLL